MTKSIASLVALTAAIATGCASVPASTDAGQPRTLGEVIARGGQKMTTEQIRQTIVGRTFARTNQQGGTLKLHLKSDDTLTGWANNWMGSVGVTGVWRGDADGKMCADFSHTDQNIQKRSMCAYYFRLGDRFFATDSNHDSSSPVRTWVLLSE